ncbi:class I SAM-dependent methyltransferase [Ideonella paludis]|nr:class I SAM-dependent methyltransferase [Ideonella paludis]
MQHATEASMQAYYAERAREYEAVYAKPERQADLAAIKAWLPAQFAGRHVLEVATGTGYWTPAAAAQAASWLATDINPETLAVAQAKTMPASVSVQLADAYTLDGVPDTFDAAFIGCWWSHIPLRRLPDWLATLHSKLQHGARVVHLDNQFVQASSTPISRQDDEGNTYQTRQLSDGRQFEVLKNFPTAEQAIALAGPRARNAQWTDFHHYWVLSYELAPQD